MKIHLESGGEHRSRRRRVVAISPILMADGFYRAAVRTVITRQRRTIRELEAENRALRAHWPMDARKVSALRLQWARAWRRWGI
jgi:hypothetical protein